jgi:hypothetical protein
MSTILNYILGVIKIKITNMCIKGNNITNSNSTDLQKTIPFFVHWNVIIELILLFYFIFSSPSTSHTLGILSPVD